MDYLIILDFAVILILLVLAHLSKRYGEALKMSPYYMLYYVGTALIILSILLTAIFTDAFFPSSAKILNIAAAATRFLAALLSAFASMQYWKWLFGEFLK